MSVMTDFSIMQYDDLVDMVLLQLKQVSLQTTQIYAEVSQETMNKQLKSWNEKWFLDETNIDVFDEKKIPDFLK